jgi:hypothetical protein
MERFPVCKAERSTVELAPWHGPGTMVILSGTSYLSREEAGRVVVRLTLVS